MHSAQHTFPRHAGEEHLPEGAWGRARGERLGCFVRDVGTLSRCHRTLWDPALLPKDAERGCSRQLGCSQSPQDQPNPEGQEQGATSRTPAARGSRGERGSGPLPRTHCLHYQGKAPLVLPGTQIGYHQRKPPGNSADAQLAKPRVVPQLA